MRAELQPPTRFGPVRAGSDLERRYPVALALYLVLGALVWFTVGEGAVEVFGRPVEIKLVALLVIGSFALRTVVARKADRIRQGGDPDGGTPRDV
ncbi:MAG: hypothetical protein WBE76_22635 [Terracidiphilus sp.]